MRYFKFEILAAAATILVAIPAIAQQTSTSQVPADFASSANARVNYYRAMAKLPPIVDDSAISAGALNHARYLVENGIGGGDIVLEKGQLRFHAPQDAFRWEVKGRPGYTDDGASAGRNAVVIVGARDRFERRRFRRPPADDAVQRAHSDGAAVLAGRTRRVLRLGPLRDRDPISFRAGEIRAHRTLRRTRERSILESQPRPDSDRDWTVAIARRISARWFHRWIAVV